MTIIYILTFIVGFLGNTIGMYVVYKRTCIANVTNIFIANMSLADLLVTLFAIPSSIAHMYIEHQWFGGFFGTFTCKVANFALYMSLSASVFTIVLISFERYFAIFYPLRGDDVRKPKIISGVIWVLSFAFASPLLVMFNVEQNPYTRKYYCVTQWSPDPSQTFEVFKIYFTLCFIVMYIVPVMFLGCLYSRISFKICMQTSPNSTPDNHSKRVRNSRKKVVRMLVGIVLLFTICWLPAHTMHYLIVYENDLVQRMPNVVFVSFWLCQANSSLNPCLYIMLNERFRQDFGRVVVEFFRRAKRGFCFMSLPSCLRRSYIHRHRSNSSSNSHSQQRRLSFVLLLQVMRGTFSSPSGRITAETKVTRNSLSVMNQAKTAADTRF